MKFSSIFILLFFLNFLNAKDIITNHEDVLNRIEAYLERSIQDESEPFLKTLLLPENQKKTVSVLLHLLENQNTSAKIKAWATFFITKLPYETAEIFFPTLIVSLKAQNWQIKINSANTLGFFKVSRAAEHLLPLLQDKDGLVVKSTEDALRKILNASHLPLLVQEFGKYDSEAKRIIVSLVGEIVHPASRNFLIEMTKSNSLGVKKTALYYLGQNSHTVSLLIPFLQDSEADIRYISCLLLGRQKIESAFSDILPCLKDPDINVRKASIWALSQISVPKSINALNDFIITKVSQKDLSLLPIQEDLVTALMISGLKGNKNVLDFCQKILERNDVHEQYRAKLIYGLSGLQNKETFFYLLKKFEKTTPFLKRICALSLWKISIAQRNSSNASKKTDSISSGLPSLDTGQYVIYSDVGEDFLHETGILMEYLYGYYHSIFSSITKVSSPSNPDYVVATALETEDVRPPSTKEGKKDTTVYIFRQKKEFQEYAQEKYQEWPFLLDSSAYYVHKSMEMVTYNREEENFVRRTLFHETMHQIFLHYVPEPPIWINEGLAEYFCNFEYKDGIYKTGKLSLNHLALLKKMLIEGSYIPISDLIKLNHNSFHNDNFGPKEMGNYAQSWSLVYFFMNAENEKYKNLTREYLLALFSEKKPDKAFQEVLQKHQLNMSILSQKWQAYFLTLPETHMSEYCPDDYSY